MPDLIDQFIHIGVGLAAGLIVGVERGWTEGAQARSNPGVRTFSLVGLLGASASLVNVDFFVLLALLAVASMAVASYLLVGRRSDTLGYTTEVALVATFVMGTLAGQGQHLLAVAIAVVTAFLLGIKTELHDVLRRIDRTELMSAIQLMIVAVVLLPLLPNESVWVEGLVPYRIGWFVLLILSLSFLGYVSIKLFGSRLGIMLTALFGGLTSSTSTTAAFSRMAVGAPAIAGGLGTGTLIACAVMPVRLLVIITVVDATLFDQIALPLLGLASVPLGVALRQSLKSDASQRDHPELELSSPLDLKSALVFAAFMTTLFLVLPFLEVRYGDWGIYMVAAISGLTDVDAIGIALANKAGQLLSLDVAGAAIIVAAIVNTLVKAGIASAFSKGRLSKSVSVVLIVASTFAALITAALATF